MLVTMVRDQLIQLVTAQDLSVSSMLKDNATRCLSNMRERFQDQSVSRFQGNSATQLPTRLPEKSALNTVDMGMVMDMVAMDIMENKLIVTTVPSFYL